MTPGFDPLRSTTVQRVWPLERESERICQNLSEHRSCKGNLITLGRLPSGPHSVHQVVALGLIYLILAGCAAQPSLGASRQPDSLGQVFNIAVLPWATPARSSNDLILFSPVARRTTTTTTTLQGCPPILSSPNLTFRSWVRPLRLLHERHDALFFPPERVLPCQAPRNPICSSLSCKWREAIPPIAYCMQTS